MSRRQARKESVQTLYQLEINPGNEEQAISETKERMTHKKNEPFDFAFYMQLIQGVRENQEELDRSLQRFLKKEWSVSRLSTVDRTILRMAAYELLFIKEVPIGAVLNEAIEMAKIYSTEESVRFINGVLGSFVKQVDEDRKWIE